MAYLANHEQIKQVKQLILCNNIHHKVCCKIEPFAVEELAQGNWQGLLSLTICNNIIMKIKVRDPSEMKNADKSAI